MKIDQLNINKKYSSAVFMPASGRFVAENV